MQILTPEQSAALGKFLWEGVDKLIWFLLGIGGLMIWKKLKHVASLIETAAALPSQLEAHTMEDKSQFKQQGQLISSEANKTREEVKRAMQQHISHYHAHSAANE